MPRKSPFAKRVEEDDPLKGVEGYEVGNDNPDNEGKVLEEVFGELGANAAGVRIYRRGKKNKYEYVATLTPDQFNQDFMKEEYGGGDYMVQIWDSNKKFIKSLRFNIDERIKGRLDNPVSADIRPHTEVMQTMAKLQADQSRDVLQMMMSKSDETMKMMMMMMQGMAQMAQQQTQMMVAAMTNRGSNQENSIDNLIKLKMAFGTDTPAEKLIDMWHKGMEAAQDQKEKPFWQELLLGMAPQVPALLGNKFPLPVAKVDNLQPPTPKPPTDPMQLQMMSEIEAQIKWLENACVFKTEPAEVADKLADWFEKYKQEAALCAFLERPDWFQLVLQKVPHAVKYQEHLVKIRDEILKLYAPDETPSESNS